MNTFSRKVPTASWTQKGKFQCINYSTHSKLEDTGKRTLNALMCVNIHYLKSKKGDKLKSIKNYWVGLAVSCFRIHQLLSYKIIYCPLLYSHDCVFNRIIFLFHCVELCENIPRNYLVLLRVNGKGNEDVFALVSHLFLPFSSPKYPFCSESVCETSFHRTDLSIYSKKHLEMTGLNYQKIPV